MAISALLLGFEPFDNHQRNPSQELVLSLSSDAALAPYVAAAVLPVSAGRVPALLQDLLAMHDPRFVFAFGLYSGEVIAVERVALNLCDFRIPDADGETLQDRPVIEGGPAAYFSTLPTREMYRALLSEEIPACLSLSAGSYLCNFLLYRLLHSAQGKYQAGFFHLPPLPGMSSGATMSFDQMQRAARTLLQRCGVPAAT